MIPELVARRLSLLPDPASLVLLFFLYSFIGCVVECIVLSIEKRRPVLNRGFAVHLPFCIIYGFGCILGYLLLMPLSRNLPLLFLAGAAGATCFEFAVSRLQMRLYGDFWWDYTAKRFNFKGAVCLESTLGWGAGALFVVLFLHRILVDLVLRLPFGIRVCLAVMLVAAYAADFAYSARMAARRKIKQETQGEEIPVFED